MSYMNQTGRFVKVQIMESDSPPMAPHGTAVSRWVGRFERQQLKPKTEDSGATSPSWPLVVSEYTTQRASTNGPAVIQSYKGKHRAP
jgi:hypothetical protein